MKRTQPCLGVEALESRDCPAVNFFNNILTVTGTGGDDTILVTQTNGLIRAEGRSFNAARVTRIVITGQGGNDVITNQTKKPSTLYGGSGNDTLTGCSASDILFGGRGNDSLFGRASNDILWGGAGNDTLNGGAGTNTVNQGSPTPNIANSSIEQQIIALVNSERASRSLPPLQVNVRLNQAAYLHTLDMTNISNVYGPSTGMQHTLYGTQRPLVADRLDAAGYDNWTSGFSWGENIAYGYSSAQSVMTGWMNSDGHRDNILNSTFTEIGVSVIADSAGRLFFTQVFGYLA